LKVLDYSFEYVSKIFILGFTLDCFHKRFLSITPGNRAYVMDSDAIGLQKIVLKLLKMAARPPRYAYGINVTPHP
jgi:hypothetical protein